METKTIAGPFPTFEEASCKASSLGNLCSVFSRECLDGHERYFVECAGGKALRNVAVKTN